MELAILGLALLFASLGFVIFFILDSACKLKDYLKSKRKEDY
jgi:hypothetical protein